MQVSQQFGGAHSTRKRLQLWESHPGGDAAATEVIRRMGSRAAAISYVKDRIRAQHGTRTDWWRMVLRMVEARS